MNTYTINLSSGSTSQTLYLNTVYLTDVTEITLNLLSVFDGILPSRIFINWGDGSETESYNRSFFKDYRKDSIIYEVLSGKESVLLSQFYSHILYSSDSTLQLVLTSQVDIVYSDNNQTRFIIPITIGSGSYYDTIYDINLVGTNLLPLSSNSVNFVFSTEKDGYIIESSNI